MKIHHAMYDTQIGYTMIGNTLYIWNFATGYCGMIDNRPDVPAAYSYMF